MANHKSAIKRIRQSDKRRTHNRTWRSRTRTFVKKARTAQQGTDMKAAVEATTTAIAELDKSASKGIIHKNNAARRKSRLMKQLNAAQEKAAAAPVPKTSKK
ncbi:MAG TPA: 30S ribosomal protein S20 [Candidatus Limnocylindrales bacterium]|nr:30S ribosomal protein S20 [Candidatus Limnocylindrales bacterium]